MKNRKSLLFILAFFAGIAFCVSASAASSGRCGRHGNDLSDNLTWTLDDEGLLTITGTGDMYNYSDKQVSGGRPGEYRYYDMDQVITAALEKTCELLKV